MNLNHHVSDVWVFRRREAGVEYLLLYTSEEKEQRHCVTGADAPARDLKLR